ncbi:MAG: adenosine deaminase [Lachnospiraceae bacterium]|nr:adenosine deaminase [Lachnospiraceae bacterium]
MTIDEVIRLIPKAENHYHIDSIAPELIWKFSQRNHVDIAVKSLADIKEYYQFSNLSEFIEKSMMAISTICTEEDFFDMVIDCAKDMQRQNIVYREAMINYTALFGCRGIPLKDMVRGLQRGIEKARQQYGVDIQIIAELDRTASADTNCSYLQELAQFLDTLPVIAVGLDMQEDGYPAHLQERAFEKAKELGLYTTAHAGEDSGAESVWDTIRSLRPDRIDHGVRAVEDQALLTHLSENGVFLTLCPDSNVCLGVYDSWENFPLPVLLSNHVRCSINSDDPPCFTYDLTGNLSRAAQTFSLSIDEVVFLVRNAFKYSFAGKKYLPMVDAWVKENLPESLLPAQE